MKTLTQLVITALCAACAWQATGHAASPPSRQITPSRNNSDVVPDGITYYQGQTFLLLNGRAARITSTLVPEGKVLTRAGRLVPLPLQFTGKMAALTYITPSAASDAVQDAIVHAKGLSYVVRGTSLVLINAGLIPEGQVLNAAHTLSPLPSDFSGFNLERTPNGLSTLPVRSDNNQALSRQAGVPQIAAKATPMPARTATSPPMVSSAGAGTGAVRKNSGTTPVATTMMSTQLTNATPLRPDVSTTIQNAPPPSPATDAPVQMPMRTDYRGESSNPLLPLPPIGSDIPQDLPPTSTGNP